MNKSDTRIINYTNAFEEAAFAYYDASINQDLEGTSVANYKVEKPHINFYEALIKVANYFLEGNDLDVDDDAKDLIDQKFAKLEEELKNDEINAEEVRRALLFLDITGFKNLNFSLDIITPDAICTIIAQMAKKILQNKTNPSIVDFNIGVGNLAFSVINNLDEGAMLTGFDNHELMARVATMKANLMQVKLEMYHLDALEALPQNVDLVISDLAEYDYENEAFSSDLYKQGVRYFPYLLIEHALKIKNDCKYIFVIDNNFFSKKGNKEFKQMLDESGNISCLVALPDSFFINKKETKSIIVLNNKKEAKHSGTQIFTLPALQDNKAFLDVYMSILDYLSKN